MILVTGATGQVGRGVVTRLVGRGARVRALSRQPEKAALPAAVEVVQGSPDDADSLHAALAGVEKAFVVLTGDIDSQAQTLATAAAAGTLRHMVVLSSSAVLHPVPHAIKDNHEKAERAIRGTGVPWTFLRPGPFHTNSLWWAKTIQTRGVARCLIGNNPGAPIDPDDIAAVAVQVLSEEGHEYSSYELTGGELLTSEEQVRIIGDALGKEIEFLVATKSEATDVFTDLSWDREASTTNIEALHSPRVPWGRTVETVKEITGRAPRTFREWATTNAHLFR
ncbi:uncharacterized protein YbjT (DUF2867 family) [Saccharothrix ecbatanensis]|uniref:Uncharacterized protein YbjT (DUF2867 family) n=1 Tax=Saccharothrix ecbatanensis TaxID=1105145 RepID=A0A7W9LZS3_9PSEU|nr:NAD(P)H-binding protein [Saccharothrix ecbatanensis]MBB5802210.1 uncharacterized protein YbjT (DUF2867 family) [Saccharothrix ecbatanensis]